MNSITVDGCYLIYNRKFYGVTKSVKLSCNERSVNFSDLTTPNSSQFQQGHRREVAVDVTLNSTSAVELLLRNGELLQPETSISSSGDGRELVLISVKKNCGWRIPLATLKSRFSQSIQPKNSMLELGFLAWADNGAVYAEQLTNFTPYLSLLPTLEYRTISEIESELANLFDSLAPLDDSSGYSYGLVPEHMGVSVRVAEESHAIEFGVRTLTVELTLRHALHGMAINMMDALLAVLPLYQDDDSLAIALHSATTPVWQRPWFIGKIVLNVELSQKI